MKYRCPYCGGWRRDAGRPFHSFGHGFGHGFWHHGFFPGYGIGFGFPYFYNAWDLDRD